MDNRPIGVFDSGLGGLTVVKEIEKTLPYEKILYLGDTARVPYGGRSKETLTKFAIQDTNFLLSKNVKCIVIACNTVSSVTTDLLKKKIKVPIFDVINPVVKSSVRESLIKGIGIIGTNATIKSNAYEEKIKKVDKNIRVYSKACPLFVPAIEEGEIKGALIDFLVDKYLGNFTKKTFDVLILGCTHYPIITNIIKRKLDGKIRIINCGKEVAGTIKEYLLLKNINSGQKEKGKIEIYVTDYTINFEKIAKLFLGKGYLNIKKVDLE